ncbi:MAG: hypothetical protein ISQ15_04880 [Ilumatobacteraceae bacterium]|nr:hypothetical protein [Ilumatobacteraceae bacterium]
MARWAASSAVEFAGQHECFTDTPWMLGRLRASVARWATVVPGYSDHGPDVDPFEIHAMHYDTEPKS